MTHRTLTITLDEDVYAALSDGARRDDSDASTRAEQMLHAALRASDAVSLKQPRLTVPQANVQTTACVLFARPPDLAWRRKMREHNMQDAMLYESFGGLRVLASSDDTPNHGRLLHVSLSYEDRDPSWAEIRAVRAAFFPNDDVDVAMLLPRVADYVNVHPHTFHLWQTPETWGLR